MTQQKRRIYVVFADGPPTPGAFHTRRRLVDDLPVPINRAPSYYKGLSWSWLLANFRNRGKKISDAWAPMVKETEWSEIQKHWRTQSPGLILINSKAQLRREVPEITGNHSFDGGVDFGTTFNFAVHITEAATGEIDIDEIYNEVRRHFLLAKSCLRQIKMLNQKLPPAVVEDFTDLEITLDEFFMAPEPISTQRLGSTNLHPAASRPASWQTNRRETRKEYYAKLVR